MTRLAWFAAGVLVGVVAVYAHLVAVLADPDPDRPWNLEEAIR